MATMVSALVLSAGLGTRLRPLTAHLPKALVPIGDRPALAHLLYRLRALVGPVGAIVVNAHHEAAAIDAFAKESPVSFVVSYETDLLGTGGALHYAAELLGPGEVIVWNGDIWTELAQDALAPLGGGVSAALIVEEREGDTGNVGIAADGSIVRLRRVTATDRLPEVRSANFLGVHRIGAELRHRAPLSGCAIADLYLPAIAAGLRLEARVTREPWIDVGSPAQYLAANLAWLAGRESFVGAGADIGPNAQMERAIVGAGARVSGEGPLCRVVVWPGGHAVAPLADAIVLPGQIVDLSLGVPVRRV
jgi:mannose-1-phosphate guanylyltransferase